MSKSQIARHFLQRLSRSAKSSAHAQRLRQSRRPQLEYLEDRTVLSILFGDTPGLTVSDNNGPVLGNLQERLVFWGNGWNSGVGPALRTQMQNAVDTLNTSTYFFSLLPGADLSQYRPGNQSRPTRVASFTTTFNSPGTTFTNTDVFNMLVHEFGMTPNFYYYVVPDPNSTPVGCGCGALHTFWTQGSNREYYGFSRNLATPSIDDLTLLYSHELAESITDPDGTALQVNPRNPSAWNEISDGEAQNYAYRVSGIWAQSYWSRANGRFTVPTGQSQNFFVSAGRVLSVNGDQVTTNDTITLDVSGGGVRVTLNGEVAQFDPGQINSIVVNSGTGNDVINVFRTLGGVPLTVNSTGNATVNVGVGGNVSGVQGSVTINNPPSRTTVNVDDSTDPFFRSVAMDTVTIGLSNYGRITGLGSAPVQYKFGDTNTVTLHTGTGGATVNVLSTGRPVTLVGHGVANTTVNVGNAGRLTDILADITVTNPPDFSTVHVDDSADPIARNVTLDTVSIGGFDHGRISFGGALILYKYRDTVSMTLDTGTGGATLNVLATGKPVTLVGHGVGNTTVNVGNAGRLTDILANITVTNPPDFTTVHVDDSADPVARNVTLDTVSISGFDHGRISFGGALILYKYRDTASMTLDTGTGGATVNVLATVKPVALVGHGPAVVNVGNAGSVQDILGAITVSNPPDFTTLNVDDSADPSSRTVAMSITGSLGSITGLAPAAINYSETSSDVSSVTVNGGSGGNIFDIESTAAAAATTVNAGTGGDCFHITPVAQYLAGIAGGLTLNGSGGGADILDFFDTNNPAAETYTFDAVPSNLSLATIPVSINFSGMAGVYLMTNGASTVNDPSGTVIVDPVGGPPCGPRSGRGERELVPARIDAFFAGDKVFEPRSAEHAVVASVAKDFSSVHTSRSRLHRALRTTEVALFDV